MTVNDDDLALVRRCLRNEVDATRLLIGRFQGEVYGVCVRLLRDRHEAEDVTQEVFLRVFRSLRTWDPARPLKPWVVSIAVNRCRTWLSRRSRRPELVEFLHETVPARAADDSAELVREIALALEGLRLDYRTVFVLYHEQGQSYEEIAAAIGRPVGTIKTWLHRARLEVLDKLRDRGMMPLDTEPSALGWKAP